MLCGFLFAPQRNFANSEVKKNLILKSGKKNISLQQGKQNRGLYDILLAYDLSISMTVLHVFLFTEIQQQAKIYTH